MLLLQMLNEDEDSRCPDAVRAVVDGDWISSFGSGHICANAFAFPPFIRSCLWCLPALTPTLYCALTSPRTWKLWRHASASRDPASTGLISRVSHCLLFAFESPSVCRSEVQQYSPSKARRTSGTASRTSSACGSMARAHVDST